MGTRQFLVGTLATALAFFSSPVASEPSDPTEELAIFGRSGQLLQMGTRVGETRNDAARSSGEFIPNIQVDPGIAPEHRMPVVCWGPGEDLYATYAQRVDHYNPQHCIFTRSSDAGNTWADEVIVSDLTVNAVICPGITMLPDDGIGVVWNMMNFAPYNYDVRFSRSDDGGATFGSSVRVHPNNPNETYYRPAIVSAGDRIGVAYFRQGGAIFFVSSGDGGSTWSTPVLVNPPQSADYTGSSPRLTVNAALDELAVAWEAGDRIYFSKSTDDGASWIPRVQVSAPQAVYASYPDMDVDAVGTYYIVWNDSRLGDTDVYISTSVDGGVTWSDDQKVNTTAPSGNQYEPHIRIDPADGIHVAWIWNLPFQTNIDLYYTYSEDGGATWLSPNPRVNDVPYSVQPYVAWTLDLLADDASAAYLFWNDGRESDYYDHIYFSRDDDPVSVPSTREKRAAFAVWASPNPFRTQTRIGFDLPAESSVRIEIFDASGRSVDVRWSGPGSREVVWRSDRRSTPGVFFVRLVSHGAVAVERLTRLN